jgi:hypothetical protein
MKNHSIFNVDNDFIQSIFSEAQNGSNGLKKESPSNKRNGSFLFPIFLELIQRIEQSMESIKQVTQLSRGQFVGRTSGDQFYQVIREETEKVDLLLSSVQNFIKLSSPVKKRDTVHQIIEETLKKHRAGIEEKKVRVLKKLEEGLPEIIAPDEHLKYIFDSLLQYALVIIPPNGGIGFVTRSASIQKESKEDRPHFVDEGKFVELLVLFDGYRETGSSHGTGLKDAFPKKKESPGIEVRLIEEMVTRNLGKMTFEIDEKKRRTSISIKFPQERRKSFH